MSSSSTSPLLPPEAQKVLELFPEFQMGQFNDSGANGYVLIGHHEVLRQDVAIKIYFHEKNEVVQEPALLAAINHENVLRVHDARRLSNTCSFFMTPVANYGDLSKYLGDYNLSLGLAHSLLCQLLSGVAALHAEPSRLVHRDLKPENLLVHDDKILIADLGSVRQVSPESGKAPASKHSILFRPPEAFGPQAYFDFSSDVYQAGLVGYLLLGGHLNYDLETHLSQREKKRLAELRGDWAEECLHVDACIERRISSGRLISWGDIPRFIPKRLVTVVRRAVSSGESRYCTASEFLVALQHLRSTLPNWMITSEGWQLTDWQGRDYLIKTGPNQAKVMKRKFGNEKWISDNRFNGTNPETLFDQLAKEIGLQ